MGQRDVRFTLIHKAKMDQASFIKGTPSGTKLYWDKESQRKQDLMSMAESIPLKDIKTGKKSRQFHCFKMKVVQK